jgi:DNA-binding transcriptional MerR regulator
MKRSNSGRKAKLVRRDRSTPIYNIGAASRLTGMEVWTLRWVEQHGLVAPARTEGHQRLFSDADIERLNMIRELLEERVNLAGIRVIFRMRLTVSRSGGEEG